MIEKSKRLERPVNIGWNASVQAKEGVSPGHWKMPIVRQGECNGDLPSLHRDVLAEGQRANLAKLSKERDPDGVIMLYTNNALGELAYTAVNCNRDDVMSQEAGGRSWELTVRDRTYVWNGNGDPTPSLLSTSDREGIPAVGPRYCSTQRMLLSAPDGRSPHIRLSADLEVESPTAACRSPPAAPGSLPRPPDLHVNVVVRHR